MTSPYVDVIQQNRRFPRSPGKPTSGAGGDVVDWTLAIVLITFVLLGIFVLLQQIGLKLAFYAGQKRFFSPGHAEGNDDDVWAEREGAEDGFGDSIPLSMGGRSPTGMYNRRVIVPVNSMISNGESNATMKHGKDSNSVPSHHHEGSIEMVATSTSLACPTTPPPVRMTQQDDKVHLPLRLARHPDLVEMPNLRSTSKVAVPVRHKSMSDSDTESDPPDNSTMNNVVV
eukprot:CAMPEP_0116835362 /NCGR_PEP_ID=MMETSP0418-20121206/7505_1 /TAXON_ID=1158023 /ORGANISM="Astrosyne radiata, Strain 13vi08-1A" /LENGTH=227 /DNA_ID=CAMNT_0004465025 /DNA_START=169 /DNA_END=852 /DNA_ORIENTATION=-